jgi:hypothetical protein
MHHHTQLEEVGFEWQAPEYQTRDNSQRARENA